jgi:RNAse (barnase) inhibitor barstar
MKPIVIDWAAIGSREEFYDRVLPQMDAPSWHGRTLDALQDSWVNGCICPDGPPFAFEFKRSASSAQTCSTLHLRLRRSPAPPSNATAAHSHPTTATPRGSQTPNSLCAIPAICGAFQ